MRFQQYKNLSIGDIIFQEDLSISVHSAFKWIYGLETRYDYRFRVLKLNGKLAFKRSV